MRIRDRLRYMCSKNRKCYCACCGKERKYYVYTVSDIPGRIGEKHIRFPGRMARCMVCHTLVFPEEIQEFNKTAYKHAVSTYI